MAEVGVVIPEVNICYVVACGTNSRAAALCRCAALGKASITLMLVRCSFNIDA